MLLCTHIPAELSLKEKVVRWEKKQTETKNWKKPLQTINLPPPGKSEVLENMENNVLNILAIRQTFASALNNIVLVCYEWKYQIISKCNP